MDQFGCSSFIPADNGPIRIPINCGSGHLCNGNNQSRYIERGTLAVDWIGGALGWLGAILLQSSHLVLIISICGVMPGQNTDVCSGCHRIDTLVGRMERLQYIWSKRWWNYNSFLVSDDSINCGQEVSKFVVLTDLLWYIIFVVWESSFNSFLSCNSRMIGSLVVSSRTWFQVTEWNALREDAVAV